MLLTDTTFHVCRLNTSQETWGSYFHSGAAQVLTAQTQAQHLLGGQLELTQVQGLTQYGIITSCMSQRFNASRAEAE